MSSEEDDNQSQGMSEKELQALEDRLLRKIMAKVKPGGSSMSPPTQEGEQGLASWVTIINGG